MRCQGAFARSKGEKRPVGFSIIANISPKTLSIRPEKFQSIRIHSACVRTKRFHIRLTSGLLGYKPFLHLVVDLSGPKWIEMAINGR